MLDFDWLRVHRGSIKSVRGCVLFKSATLNLPGIFSKLFGTDTVGFFQFFRQISSLLSFFNLTEGIQALLGGCSLRAKYSDDMCKLQGQTAREGLSSQ